MTKVIHIDFETRSAAVLSPAAKSVGSYKYSKDPTTQILCACYALDEGPVVKWAPWGMGFGFDDRCRTYFERKRIPAKRRFGCPDDLREAVLSGALIAAHNSMFERGIWENILTPRYGWPVVRHEQWLCTMATARYNGLPGGLGAASEALLLPFAKSDNTAMKKMCKPRAAWLNTKKGAPWVADAALYDELVDYCAQDVVVERALYDECAPLPPSEREIWLMDQEVNLRGIPIDVELARVASRQADLIFESACVELAEITEGAVTRPTQTARLLGWLQRFIIISDIQGPTIQYHLNRERREEGYMRPKVKRVLEIRQLAGGNALTKYKAFLRYEVDGRVYDSFRYYGGHTGRASAQNVQLQNLIRPPMEADKAEGYIDRLKRGDPIDTDMKRLLDSLVRAVVCAETGRTLFAIDYASIEARGVVWLAGQWDAVRAFSRWDATGRTDRTGDPYVIMASKIYRIPVEMIDDNERKLGKIAVLGCGYGMGPVRFSEQCDDWGVDVTDKLAKTAVYAYRDTHPKVTALWYEMDAKAKACVRTGKTQKAGRNIYFRMRRIGNIDALTLVLPSGRALYYPQARVEGDRLQYWGRARTGRVGFVDIWGGGLVENAVQGFCRDLLMHAMLRIKEFVAIIMHVHDEDVGSVPAKHAEEMYKRACDVMTTPPAWARGLPVAVDGWIGERYKK